MHKCSICKEIMTYETKKVEGKWQGAWHCEEHGFATVEAKVYIEYNKMEQDYLLNNEWEWTDFDWEDYHD